MTGPQPPSRTTSGVAVVGDPFPLLRIDEEALRRRSELEQEGARTGGPADAPRDDGPLVAELVGSRLGVRREPCANCGLPVFLAEKLVVEHSVYHRSCFRCGRCRHQLTPGNYYETEDGQYCCEACPMDERNDEPDYQEQPASPRHTTSRELTDHHHLHRPTTTTTTTTTTMTTTFPPSSHPAPEPRPPNLGGDLLEAPLSDEEKSKRRSLERSVDRLLRRRQSQLGLVASHLLGDPDQPAEDRPAPETRPGSAEERAAGPPPPPPEDVDDDEFDAMLKLINERIVALTSEQPAAPAADPAVERRRASCDGPPRARAERRPATPPALRRSSSLGSAGQRARAGRSPEARRSSSARRGPRLPGPEAPPEEPGPPAPRGTRPAARRPEQDYPEELNPFADEEEKTEPPPASPERKPPSTNPFGSGSSSDEERPAPRPTARAGRPAAARAATLDGPRRRLLEAPRINLNPFESDEEDGPSGAESEPELRSKGPPVPKPRVFRHSHVDGGLQPRFNLRSSSIHSSNTSIASSCSTITLGGTYRKKKPAPPPPPIQHQSPESQARLLNVGSSPSPGLSPRLTPRTRKAKPAPPPPPPLTSTPPPPPPGARGEDEGPNGPPDSPRIESQPPDNDRRARHVWDDAKLSKDEANRNTQSLSCTDGSAYLGCSPDKSVDGKWKRKKGPAPPRPTPLRRKIKVMSMKDVKLELDQIEMQQQGLEKQGVRLEQIIRDKCESGPASEDTSLALDVEELVLELFALVNEKNELFRRQAELMLLRRQQRLEEEHADIEYQVRCLITQPEATKTDFDKQREETLIQRLVEIVERRNEIVECLEMDRKREMEEDRSIQREMDLYAARNKTDNVNMTDESRRSLKMKKGKVKEKVKEKKFKKSNKKDADKDVDETEAKLKRHSLRKWF